MLSITDRIFIEDRVGRGIEYFEEFHGEFWREGIDITKIKSRSKDNNILSLVTGDDWPRCVRHFDEVYPKVGYSEFGFDNNIGNGSGSRHYETKLELEALAYLDALWVLAVAGHTYIWDED